MTAAATMNRSAMPPLPPGLTIRPFDESSLADYDALASVGNAIEPDSPRTAGEVRDWDKRRDPRAKHARYLAEWNGVVVGEGSYNQSPWNYHPRKFDMSVGVKPEHQNKGIGAALYETVLEAVCAAHDPLRVTTYTRADRERAVRFLSDRGFVEEMREWESRLDVPAFDFTPYEAEGAEQRVESKGIVLTTFGRLADDPERDRKIHALENRLGADVPSTDPHTDVSFEQWQKMLLGSPNFLPDGYQVAVHQATGEYVGLSMLFARQADRDLDTGLTGVSRDWRRQGVALALKLRAIRFAKEYGAPCIRTENEINNRGMLGINERLGFVKQPAWIVFVKRIAEKDESES